MMSDLELHFRREDCSDKPINRRKFYTIEKPTYEHVEHPSHYNTYPMETIDMMVAIWGKEKVADWCEITAFKYRMRMGTKPDNSIEQDLKKEQWYLNKAKELRNECVE